MPDALHAEALRLAERANRGEISRLEEYRGLELLQRLRSAENATAPKPFAAGLVLTPWFFAVGLVQR